MARMRNPFHNVIEDETTMTELVYNLMRASGPFRDAVLKTCLFKDERDQIGPDDCDTQFVPGGDHRVPALAVVNDRFRILFEIKTRNETPLAPRQPESYLEYLMRDPELDIDRWLILLCPPGYAHSQLAGDLPRRQQGCWEDRLVAFVEENPLPEIHWDVYTWTYIIGFAAGKWTHWYECDGEVIGRVGAVTEEGGQRLGRVELFGTEERTKFETGGHSGFGAVQISLDPIDATMRGEMPQMFSGTLHPDARLIPITCHRDLQPGDEFFSEFIRLLKAMYDPLDVSFTKEDCDMMFDKRVPDVLRKLMKIVDGVETSMKNEEIKIVGKGSARVHYGFRLMADGQEILYFGMWYEYWTKYGSPLCFGIDDKNYPGPVVEEFKRRHRSECQVLRGEQDPGFWYLCGVPREALESEDAGREVFQLIGAELAALRRALKPPGAAS